MDYTGAGGGLFDDEEAARTLTNQNKPAPAATGAEKLRFLVKLQAFTALSSGLPVDVVIDPAR